MKTCSFPLCGDNAHSKGLCMGHYLQRRRGDELRPKDARLGRTNTTRGKVCPVRGCGRLQNKAGLCGSHGTTSWRMNISPEALVDLLDGACMSCGDMTAKLQLDHDHACCDYDGIAASRSCGKCIRGAVCQPCNLTVGRLEDPNSRVSKALTYLNSGHREELRPAVSSARGNPS